MYFTEGRTNLHREAIRPKGPSASLKGFMPIFLRKPICTYDFPVEGVQTPCPLSVSMHAK